MLATRRQLRNQPAELRSRRRKPRRRRPPLRPKRRPLNLLPSLNRTRARACCEIEASGLSWTQIGKCMRPLLRPSALAGEA